MYTREQFGKALKELVLKKESTINIGSWAYSVYFQHMAEIDVTFEAMLLKLSNMEEGADFARSYEELNDIANKLIAGEDVKL